MMTKIDWTHLIFEKDGVRSQMRRENKLKKRSLEHNRCSIVHTHLTTKKKMTQ